MPRVTIILNSYNQAAYLTEAIASALAQTMTDFELLLVDNGSTDGSAAIMRQHADDPRVRLLLHEENDAITKRFNEAVDAAEGELISFLYSDDVLLPHKLERQVMAFDAAGPDTGVVYGPAFGLNVITGERWTYGSIGASGWVFDALLRDHFLGQIDMVTPLTRRECLLRHRFYEDVFAEGEGVFFRIALTHRFVHLDEPVAVLRDHGVNAGKAVRRNAEMTMVMLDRLAVHSDLPPSGAAEVRAFKARLLRAYAWQGARLGEPAAWVRRCLADALRTRPIVAVNPRWLGALALAHLPASTRQRLNARATNLRGEARNDVLVEGFGGGDT